MKRELLKGIKHLVFDLDGTVYCGSVLFPYTLEAFDIFDACGLTYTYLTNNSSLSANDYIGKIQKLGLRGDLENLYTSSLASLECLRKNYSTAKTIYLLGTESLRREFVEAGYRVLFGDDKEEPDIVVVAFDTSLTYAALCKTAWWVKHGKPFVATHPDKICPSNQPTLLVDCGAICDCITSATGRKPDHLLGKPDRSMIDGIRQKHGLAPHEIAMVGDRLYTDIEMARRAGIVGVLVLSGEATRNDLMRSDLSPEIVCEHILELAQLLREAKN